jgi:hypothetical protein
MLDEVTKNVETALEVVEHAAEVTEKLAANVANALPENGTLHKLAEEVEYIAEIVDKDAQKVEIIIKKVCMSIVVYIYHHVKDIYISNENVMSTVHD